MRQDAAQSPDYKLDPISMDQNLPRFKGGHHLGQLLFIAPLLNMKGVGLGVRPVTESGLHADNPVRAGSAVRPTDNPVHTDISSAATVQRFNFFLFG